VQGVSGSVAVVDQYCHFSATEGTVVRLAHAYGFAIIYALPSSTIEIEGSSFTENTAVNHSSVFYGI